MEERESWREVSGLLHDARLRCLEWDPALAGVTLEFDCLRRAADGSALDDPGVEFRLGGVQAIIAGYESALCGVRPSAYRPARLLGPGDLRDWAFGPQEAYLSVNSPAAEEDALHAPLTRWLAGDGESLHACPYRVGLKFANTGMLGVPANDVTLLLGCEAVEVFSGGVPLDLDTWREQFRAWWEHWRRHWEAKQARGDEAGEPCYEDTFIPAAADPPPDRSYRPPGEPAVLWEPTDAPEELLRPITDLFEAKHQRDWPRLGRAWPNLDQTPQQRAEQLAQWAEQEHGRWEYARQVDGWWAEGRHAEVVVRGVEHTMPGDGDPADNVETVWTFRLRRGSGGWYIRTWSQGWPPYGSAPARPAVEKPWLGRWRSGEVRS